MTSKTMTSNEWLIGMCRAILDFEKDIDKRVINQAITEGLEIMNRRKRYLTEPLDIDEVKRYLYNWYDV